MTQIDRINGLVGSIAVKAPCKAATTANITLSGAQTIDGVSLISGDRCLVKDQSTASENGIYDVSDTDWSRAIDFNGRRDIVQGTAVRIVSGTVSAQYFYEITTEDPIIGNTDLAFALVNFPVTTTPFMATLLDDTTAAEARATLLAAGTSDNNTFSGTQTFQKTAYWKKGADIPSANDLPLSTDGNYNDITGTATINGMTDGVQNEVRKFHFDAAVTLKHDTAPTAGFSKFWIPSEADYLTAANNEIEFIYDGAYWRLTSLNISNFFRGALVGTTNIQVITDLTETAVVFDTEDYDTESIHDNAINNTRLTVPSGVTKVRLNAQIAVNDADLTNTTTERIRITKNGSDNYAGAAVAERRFSGTSNGTFMSRNISSPVYIVTSGDYFEVKVYFETVGGNAISLHNPNSFTWFSMEIIE